MDGGLGVMGEAGPEAIMPLSRMSSGNLGVEVNLSGTPPFAVNVAPSILLQQSSEPSSASSSKVEITYAPQITLGASEGDDSAELVSSLEQSQLRQFEHFSRNVLPNRMVEIAQSGGQFSRTIGLRS
jgi:hypothetical protein